MAKKHSKEIDINDPRQLLAWARNNLKNRRKREAAVERLCKREHEAMAKARKMKFRIGASPVIKSL